MDQDILDEGLFERERTFDKDTAILINKTKTNANESIRHVKNGRNALVVLAVVTTLASFFVAFTSDTDVSEFLLIAAFNLIIYLAAAIMTPRNPSIYLTAGTIIWVLVILINMLVEPLSIISGILWKVIIGYYLFTGVNHAFQLKKFSQSLFQLGVPQSDMDKIRALEYIPKTPIISQIVKPINTQENNEDLST